MLKRFQFISQYATTQQLNVALTLDSIMLILFSTITGFLIAQKHFLWSVPFALLGLVGGVSVGASIHLILRLRAKAKPE